MLGNVTITAAYAQYQGLGRTLSKDTNGKDTLSS